MVATLQRNPAKPASGEPLGRRERKKLALRTRLVEECRALIEERGVEGSTVEALCERVDVSKKTFYNYFESKNALVVEICQSHLLVSLEELIHLSEDSDASCGDKVDLLITTMFASPDAIDSLDMELIDYMVSNFGTNRGVSIGLLDEMNQLYIRFYERHQDALLPGYSPEFCGEMTAGMIIGMMLNWMNHRDAPPPKQKVEAVCAYIKRSMLKEGA